MKLRGKWVLLAAGLMALVALVVFAVIKDREPAVSPAEAKARQLIEELRPLSTFERWLDRLGVMKARQRRPRNQVRDDLGALGTPAIRPLIEALHETPDSRVGIYSASALARIGRPAVPALLKALDHRSPYVRRRAVVVLGVIGPDAEQAVPRVVEALNDEDMGVRANAANALGGIGPAAAPAVPALIDALKYGHWHLRPSVARALGDLGPTAKAAIPALKQALKDESWEVRQPAAEALKKIQQPTPAAKP